MKLYSDCRSDVKTGPEVEQNFFNVLSTMTGDGANWCKTKLLQEAGVTQEVRNENSLVRL